MDSKEKMYAEMCLCSSVIVKMFTDARSDGCTHDVHQRESNICPMSVNMARNFALLVPLWPFRDGEAS